MFDISNQTLTDILLVVSKFWASSENATLKCDLLIVRFFLIKKDEVMRV